MPERAIFLNTDIAHILVKTNLLKYELFVLNFRIAIKANE